MNFHIFLNGNIQIHIPNILLLKPPYQEVFNFSLSFLLAYLDFIFLSTYEFVKGQHNLNFP